jgi:hypothetical protein
MIDAQCDQKTQACSAPRRASQLQPVSDAWLEPWREAIERMVYSPGPASGPEYVLTETEGRSDFWVVRAGSLVLPLRTRATTHFWALKTPVYEGVEINSLLGVEVLNQEVFAALEQLPPQADVVLHVPSEVYSVHERVFAHQAYYPLSTCEYHKIALPATYDEWFMRRKHNRQKVRKAHKDGVTVSLGGQELLSDFYGMYLCSWRRWRDQQKVNWRHHPIERFGRIFAVPGSKTRIATARLDGKVIGAVLVSCYRATAACLYAGIDYEYRNSYPSNLLQSEIIRDLIEQGFAEYSLGTSRGLRDVERFKETLGAVRHESVILCRYGYRRLKNVASAFRSQSWRGPM